MGVSTPTHCPLQYPQNSKALRIKLGVHMYSHTHNHKLEGYSKLISKHLRSTQTISKPTQDPKRNPPHFEARPDIFSEDSGLSEYHASQPLCGRMHVREHAQRSGDRIAGQPVRLASPAGRRVAWPRLRRLVQTLASALDGPGQDPHGARPGPEFLTYPPCSHQT